MNSLFSQVPFVLILLSFIVTGCGGDSGESIPWAPEWFDVDEERVQEIIEQNRELVQKASDFLEEGAVLEAKGSTASQCQSTFYHYDLKKEDDALKLEWRVYFKGPEELQSRVERCLRKTEDFMMQYGLVLEIINSSRWKSHQVVELIPGEGRANTTHWYENSIKDCMVVTHEVLHSLGLPDEYYEKDTCKARVFEAQEHRPHSIMETMSDRYVGIHLMPRHMLAILEQAIPSEITLQKKNGVGGEELRLPQCMLSGERSLLGVSWGSHSVINLNEKENPLIFIESSESEYQRASVWKYRRFTRPEILFEINGEEVVCPELHEAQTFIDIGEALNSEFIEATMVPFSFEDHEAYPSLYYLGRDHLNEISNE